MKKITFKSISYCAPMEILCKQHSIWLNGVNGENVTAPLVYFQKPKWIELEEWKKIMIDIGLIR